MKGAKTGGRTEGTPNKINRDLREVLKKVVDKELVNIEKTLAELEPKDRLEIIVKLLPYLITKAEQQINIEHKIIKVIVPEEDE
jgi:hypothetical protein